MTTNEKVQAARSAGVPLIAIGTPDPAATVERVRETFDGPDAKTPIPLVLWDCAQGMTAVNKAGRAVLERVLGNDEEQWPGLSTNPGMALNLMLQLPGETREGGKLVQRGTMVFALNLNELYEKQTDAAVLIAQGVWNLRDPFKKSRRQLFVLGSRHVPPAILRRDLMVFDESLPDDKELETIVRAQAEAAGVKVDDGAVSQAVDALRSMSAFTAEQVAAMSIDKGLDLDAMWGQKIADIETTKGMSVDRIDETEQDLGGMEWFVKFATRLVKGPRCPHVVVRWDEIEKSFGGLSGAGDNTGTTQDTLGVVLKKMEDNGWDGNLLVGPPGTGKTLLSKILSRLASKVSGRKVLPIAIDIGETKSKGVGDTEKAIRDVIARLESLGGKGRVYFIATCNDLDVLPAALRRRFKKGIWYVDLPTESEKKAIWDINIKKYGIDQKQKRPDDRNWTGAEIRNCCDNADSLGVDLIEAAKLIVPVSKSAPGDVEKLRRLADGRFNCVSYEGAYNATKVERLTDTVPAEAARAGRRRGEEN